MSPESVTELPLEGAVWTQLYIVLNATDSDNAKLA